MIAEIFFVCELGMAAGNKKIAADVATRAWGNEAVRDTPKKNKEV